MLSETESFGFRDFDYDFEIQVFVPYFTLFIYYNIYIVIFPYVKINLMCKIMNFRNIAIYRIEKI